MKKFFKAAALTICLYVLILLAVTIVNIAFAVLGNNLFVLLGLGCVFYVIYETLE